MTPSKCNLTIIASTIGFLSIAYFLMRNSSYNLLIVVSLTPIFFLTFNYKSFFFSGAMILEKTSLIIPGLFFGGVHAYLYFAFMSIIHAMTVVFILTKKIFFKDKVIFYSLYLFMANLLFLVIFRGAGFRIFGDNKWGGLRYILLFISSFYFMFSQINILKTETWKNIILLNLSLSAIPFIAESLFLLSQGRIYFQYYFISIGAGTIQFFSDFLNQTGTGRITSSGTFGLSLICLLLITEKKGTNVKILFYRYAGFILGFLIMSLSGHRQAILEGFGVIIIYNYITSKNRIIYSIKILTVVSFFILFGYLFARHLPFGLQRSFSFLPGIQLDPMAEWDGRSTIEWRLEVWRHGWDMAKQYFWIGHGLAFPGDTVEALMIFSPSYHVMIAVETLQFHNGPLSLLVTTGFSGFLIVSFLLIYTSYKHLRLHFRNTWFSDQIRTLHLVLTVLALVKVLTFYFVYGQIERSLSPIFFIFTALEGLNLSNSVEVSKLKSSRNENIIL